MDANSEDNTIVDESLSSEKDFGYRKRVSFNNLTDVHRSFTLRHTSFDFTRTIRTRKFMIALDLYDGTTDSIKFTLEDLIDEGDEIVVVGSYISNTIENPMTLREKGEQIMNWIKDLNKAKLKISVIIELSYNSPDHVLDQMIKMYQPSAIIVRSKNKEKYRSHYSGTGIFKCRLQTTKTPIIIVKDDGPGLSKSASSGNTIPFLPEDIKRKVLSFCFF